MLACPTGGVDQYFNDLLTRKFHEQQVGSLVPWRVVIRI
jgi:hypothetical protein